MNRQIENRYVLRCIEGAVVGWSDTIRHFFVFPSPIIPMFHNGEILVCSIGVAPGFLKNYREWRSFKRKLLGGSN